jgi:hypothetical protein
MTESRIQEAKQGLQLLKKKMEAKGGNNKGRAPMNYETHH